jgi:hypothetical protein
LGRIRSKFRIQQIVCSPPYPEPQYCWWIFRSGSRIECTFIKVPALKIGSGSDRHHFTRIWIQPFRWIRIQVYLYHRIFVKSNNRLVFNFYDLPSFGFVSPFILAFSLSGSGSRLQLNANPVPDSKKLNLQYRYKY